MADIFGERGLAGGPAQPVAILNADGMPVVTAGAGAPTGLWALISSLVRPVVAKVFDLDVDIALGNVDGISYNDKFGLVKGIDAADAAADLWAWGSDPLAGAPTKVFPSVAGDLFIASDAAGDTDVDVTIVYLDATGVERTVTKNLDGQTPVDVEVTALDSNRMWISGATAAVGNIYLSTSGSFTAGVPDVATTVVAFIEAGYGQTEQCTYTVPSGKKMVLTLLQVSMSRGSGAAGSAEVQLRVKPSGGSVLVKREWQATDSSPVKDGTVFVFAALTQVVVRVKDVSDGDTHLTGVWKFYLVDA